MSECIEFLSICTYSINGREKANKKYHLYFENYEILLKSTMIHHYGLLFRGGKNYVLNKQ